MLMEEKNLTCECTCGKIMRLKRQEELKQGRTNLEYECDCGNVGNILLFDEEPSYNEIVKNKNGIVQKLTTKKREE